MMQARAAVAAANHAGALLLLKEHVRDCPAGRCTVEREAFLRLLERPSARR